MLLLYIITINKRPNTLRAVLSIISEIFIWRQGHTGEKFYSMITLYTDSITVECRTNYSHNMEMGSALQVQLKQRTVKLLKQAPTYCNASYNLVHTVKF